MTSNADNSSLNFNYDALCKTDVMESDKFTFVWSISRFSSRLKEKANGEYLKSKGFRILGPGSKVTDLHVRVYPNGDKISVKDHVSAYLMNDTRDAVIVSCTFLVVSPNGSKLKLREYDMKKLLPKNGSGWEKFLSRNRHELAKYTRNETLTLVVDVRVIGDNESVELVGVSKTNEALFDKYHQDQLSLDLHHLYSTKEFADITIKCEGKSYGCHKYILASRSPVFKAMFESDMKEKRTGSVEIKNMRPEVLERLLGYIYTGYASYVETLAKELLASADQYQILKLKELCELELCTNIDIKNCIELLVLGDMYQASTLRIKALGFVSQNMDKIDLSECKKTLISHPQLLFEVMEMLLPKRKTDVVDANSEGRKRARTK